MLKTLKRLKYNKELKGKFKGNLKQKINEKLRQPKLKKSTEMRSTIKVNEQEEVNCVIGSDRIYARVPTSETRGSALMKLCVLAFYKGQKIP